MIDFLDRQPTQLGRRLIVHADGTQEYVTISMADNPDVEGTPLNRAVLMALQGFEGSTTTFNADGSITETNGSGDRLTTIFNANGSITERFTNANGLSIAKTTTFNNDGTIREVMSE